MLIKKKNINDYLQIIRHSHLFKVVSISDEGQAQVA